jgi:signal transduction histidine kinase
MYRAKQLGPGSYSLLGEVVTAPSAHAGPTAVTPHEHALVAHERAIARHELKHAQLREANEKLVLAALDAQELLSAAERARQRQADFMAAVAEELANPFAPIRLASAMLGRPQSDETLLPRVQAIIEQQAQQMSRLVAAAGERARSRAANLAPAEQSSDLTAVIYAAVSDIRQTMDWRHQSLSVTMPAGPLWVRGDAERLQQLLGNLLDNASKYTPDTGTVRLEAVVDGTTVVLSVTDDGIGITPVVVPRLFEPFGHDSHALGFNGVSTGIGLPVVRVLVNELGGTVVAHSAGNGHGSRFVVTLPRPA